MAKPYIRRRTGVRCQDCGRDWIPTRTIQFWLNGMLYRVCRGCEAAYRDRSCPLSDQAAEAYQRSVAERERGRHAETT